MGSLTIADPKPHFARAPNPASSSSTTSTPPPPGKRTRDLPNLSDCHCCGRRVNYTNPKDRLQPLDSVWRIVLLCRKCRKKVCSGQTCPYCFQESTKNPVEVFTCVVCKHKIHKGCVRDYRNCTPWCYLGVEGFRVCVDCWVPESLKNSIRVCGNGSKGRGKDLFENVVDLASCASDLSVKKGKGGSMAEKANSIDGGVVEAVDDAELAIQLHRVMNSSPRISRGKCLLNSDGLAVLNTRDWKGFSYKRRLGTNHGKDPKLVMCSHNEDDKRLNQPGEKESCIISGESKLGLLPYKRDRKRKIWQFNDDDTVLSECRSRLPADINFDKRLDDQSHSCINVDRCGQELVTYKRSRFKLKTNQTNGMARVSGESSSDDAQLRTDNLVKRDNNVILPINLPSESCDAELDRYCLKYSRRVRGSKSDSSFVPYGPSLSGNQASVHAMNSKCECCQTDNMKLCLVKSDYEVILPSGTCEAERDRYHLKYGKRVRGTKSDSTQPCYDASQCENQASAPGVSDTYNFCSVKNDDKLIFPIGTRNSDPYFFKYTKRV